MGYNGRASKIRRRLFYGVLFLFIIVILLGVYMQLQKGSKPVMKSSEQVQHVFTEARDSTTTTTAKMPTLPALSLPTLSSTNNLSPDVTIVTAYFNIGSFPKGPVDTFTPSLYSKWITVFSRIVNPVVAYFDTQEAVDLFLILRESQPPNMTRVELIRRGDLWSFSVEPRIRQIFSQSWYPKHKPNTVVSNYSCAMHAKYELVQRACKDNPFNTRYVAWLDIGLFRALVTQEANPIQQSTPLFYISLPPQFNQSAVAYGQVYHIDMTLRRISEIVRFNAVWVCGCFFLGRVDVMHVWTGEYMTAVNELLKKGWMSTDQQVLYWLWTNRRTKTHLQVYESTSGPKPDYFHLGYACRKLFNDENRTTDLL